jgi:hypothetical protein
MIWDQFKFGFWHPFGPHGQESPEEIIARKRREIKSNGWTLWSFQHRLMLNEWRREIREAGDPPVFVFCSDSPTAKDPASSNPPFCTRYKVIGDHEWQPIPETVEVPHPFRLGKTTVSAFVVQKIFHPVEEFSPSTVEWLSKDGRWDSRKVSTRGETMIRPGGNVQMRRVLAILELKAPDYLALVGVNPPGELS